MPEEHLLRVDSGYTRRNVGTLRSQLMQASTQRIDCKGKDSTLLIWFIRYTTESGKGQYA